MIGLKFMQNNRHWGVAGGNAMLSPDIKSGGVSWFSNYLSPDDVGFVNSAPKFFYALGFDPSNSLEANINAGEKIDRVDLYSQRELESIVLNAIANDLLVCKHKGVFAMNPFDLSESMNKAVSIPDNILIPNTLASPARNSFYTIEVISCECGFIKDLFTFPLVVSESLLKKLKHISELNIVSVFSIDCNLTMRWEHIISRLKLAYKHFSHLGYDDLRLLFTSAALGIVDRSFDYVRHGYLESNINLAIDLYYNDKQIISVTPAGVHYV